ncbi:hypothetical protein AAVH_20804 [Aphelenchoides avenae]|nr:hypothetical protein AAVH_20804 [Aphelenchus avenae]
MSLRVFALVLLVDLDFLVNGLDEEPLWQENDAYPQEHPPAGPFGRQARTPDASLLIDEKALFEQYQRSKSAPYMRFGKRAGGRQFLKRGGARQFLKRAGGRQFGFL